MDSKSSDQIRTCDKTDTSFKEISVFSQVWLKYKRIWITYSWSQKSPFPFLSEFWKVRCLPIGTSCSPTDIWRGPWAHSLYPRGLASWAQCQLWRCRSPALKQSCLIKGCRNLSRGSPLFSQEMFFFFLRLVLFSPSCPPGVLGRCSWSLCKLLCKYTFTHPCTFLILILTRICWPDYLAWPGTCLITTNFVWQPELLFGQDLLCSCTGAVGPQTLLVGPCFAVSLNSQLTCSLVAPWDISKPFH